MDKPFGPLCLLLNAYDKTLQYHFTGLKRKETLLGCGAEVTNLVYSLSRPSPPIDLEVCT
jgi:hypothetical protein